MVFIDCRSLSEAELNKKIDKDFMLSAWIDGLGHQVCLRKKAIPEALAYIEKTFPSFDNEDDQPPFYVTIDFFHLIQELFEANSQGEELDEESREVFDFMKQNLIHDDTCTHLPVPVFSYVKPTMNTQFILHILISLGHFETEADLTAHSSLREALPNANLIGPENDAESLQEYSNKLLDLYITDQLVYFPNSERVKAPWIITVGNLLDGIIVRDILPITDLPPVQQTILIQSVSDECKAYKVRKKSDMLKAAMNELESSIARCNIPSTDEFMTATIEKPLEWDPIENFTQCPNQSLESFEEQKLAILLCVNTLDSYCDIFNKQDGTYVKCRVTHGAPGSGKSFISQYVLLYSISCGLNVSITALMANRANQLGGEHIHKMFTIQPKQNITPAWTAELAYNRIMKSPVILDNCHSCQVLFVDEAGQISAELLSVF